MIVAGGCYREVCETPYWDALYGSGGRAAKALLRLDPTIILRTYFPRDLRSSLYELEAAGVTIESVDSREAIAFAYLHPLSDPVLAPNPTSIIKELPLRVVGPSVLRFGFIEGDAVVDAKHAVYDPQTNGSPPFGANGSKCERLALVLNERELRSLGQADNLSDAASNAFAREGAVLALAKCGAHGAWLFRPRIDPLWIPAYRSERVFKIGSGDVFSAVFSYYWAVENRDAAEAADLASRSVAQYVATRDLPVSTPSSKHVAIKPVRRSVHVFGSNATLASRWLCDEALWHLRSLGATAKFVTNRANLLANQPDRDTALILGNTFKDDGASAVREATRSGLQPIMLFEDGANSDSRSSNGTWRTDDFTTALYWALWGSQ